ncbi:hypothetical protein NC651_030909 [Populus alba x Populus x berolinensis]|nr:hypothetical protein NC651_030909 [Populus alba x Populus x berolinensis]
MTCHLLITNDRSSKFEVPLLLPSPNQLLCDLSTHQYSAHSERTTYRSYFGTKPPLSSSGLMEDDVSNPFRRMSMRTRKIAPKMAAALASNDNRTQVSVFY